MYALYTTANTCITQIKISLFLNFSNQSTVIQVSYTIQFLRLMTFSPHILMLYGILNFFFSFSFLFLIPSNTGFLCYRSFFWGHSYTLYSLSQVGNSNFFQKVFLLAQYIDSVYINYYYQVELEIHTNFPNSHLLESR